MTKHALDRPRRPTEDRARKFLTPERREGLHPATQALLRRERAQGSARTRAFVRIERQGTAD